MLTALVAILVFGAMILLHELGHFLAARHYGVRVEEFSIGFGPALFTTVRNATRYSVRAFPLGGYTLLAQENDTDDDAENGRAQLALRQADAQGKICVDGKGFAEAGVWQRFFIIAAGALMNFLLGFVLLLVLQSFQDGYATRVVYDFLDGATSQSDGLKAGDKILRVNGRVCFVWSDILYELTSDDDRTVDLTVLRDNRRIKLPSVHIAMAVDEEGNELPVDFHVRGLKNKPTVVVQAAMGDFLYYARALARGFLDLFRGMASVRDLSGPVGVVSAVHEAIQYGWQDVVSLAAMLSINLGIVNLLPIPALDGCKLLFLAIEGVFHRKLPARMETAVTLAGMLALVALMLFVTFNDLLRVF